MTGSATAHSSGKATTALSRICLGTMRLSSAGDADSAADLLLLAVENGITSFHCSSEYETFPLFTEAWRRAGLWKSGATMIAKVAVPHFGEDRFSAAAFRAKVDFYLEALSIERLEIVQWLLRYDLKQEAARLRILQEATPEITMVVEQLKQEGKIGSLVAFPYSSPLADAVIAAGYCDGLALYVNPLEREMDRHVLAAEEANKFVVAIRPFAAGRVFAETSLSAAQALEHVFSFPAVETAVVSASSRSHLDEFLPYLRTA